MRLLVRLVEPSGQRVLLAPHQQMLADLVVEAAVVRAPDGAELRLTQRMAKIDAPMEPDWQLQR